MFIDSEQFKRVLYSFYLHETVYFTNFRIQIYILVHQNYTALNKFFILFKNRLYLMTELTELLKPSYIKNNPDSFQVNEELSRVIIAVGYLRTIRE